MQSQTRGEMFTNNIEYHTLLRKVGLKAALDKTFFPLKKVKFLGHVISPDGIQPIAKRVDALTNVKSPQSKRHVMKILGSLGFYSCYIRNLHQYFIYGNAKDNDRIAFPDIRWSLQISKICRLFARTKPFQIFSAETSQLKNIKSTSCNTNKSRAILGLTTNTVLRCHTKFSMKTTPIIPATNSFQYSTNKEMKKKWDYKTTARTLHSVLNPTGSECSRMGRFISRFRQICGPETQSNESVSTSKTEYSSINSLIPSEDGTDSTSPGYDSHHISTDTEDDNIVCDISIQADPARLCQAKQAHDLVLGKIDASLVKKILTTSDAPHLDTKALIQKLDEVAKTVDLDVSTILAEQMKDPVLGLYGLGFPKTPEIQQSQGHLQYCQEFDRLLIEAERQLLCYNEPLDKQEEEHLPICLPLSLFLACFRLGHYNELGGHMGATKTYANAKWFY